MKYNQLGRTGLKVSQLCLGTMQFGWTSNEQTAHQILNGALELGCNFIDSADIYSNWIEGNSGGESETIIGNWLANNRARRHELIIATKVRGPMGRAKTAQGLNRIHIMNAVEASLKRLQTDYIDLYQVHWPDDDTPLEETLSTLSDLVSSGKVRYIGCSNHPAWMLMKSQWISDVNSSNRYESLQPHYNLAHRSEYERELAAVCADQNIGVIPYSPLAGGFLTGKYRQNKSLPNSARAQRVQSRYMHENGFKLLIALDEVAGARAASVAQVSLAWLQHQPNVSAVIVGANNIDQLRETFSAGSLTLSESEIELLNAASSWS